MTSTSRRGGTDKVVWVVLIVLTILHYDFWYWDDDSLIFGFMPIGLLYHAGISLLAGLTWFFVVQFAWPSWIEEWADGGSDASGGEGEGA